MRKTALLLVLLGTGLSAPAGETTVLDLHAGSYRSFVRFRTPRLIDEGGKAVPLLAPRRRGQKEEDRKPVKDVTFPAPPPDWTAPGFDDTGWPRVRGALAKGNSRSHYPVSESWRATGANLVCVRGLFVVTDPAAVKGLKLDLLYMGGCVVYLNAKELARRHLPAGEVTPDTPADAYPREAYVGPDGKAWDWRLQNNLHDPGKYDRKTKDTPLGKLRFRSLNAVPVPAGMLRKGINVLAVEVHTAPVRDLLVSMRKTVKWPHAGLYEATLKASGAAGLEPGVGPKPGLSVQSVQPCEPTAAWDYALPAGKAGPIRMVGARNATFSGKVLVSSSAAIRGLKASVGALKLDGGEGGIPAAAIRVRCEPGGNGRLLEEFPAEIAPVEAWANRVHAKAPPTANANVWVTVRVPGEAGAGVYRGKLEVSAAGAGAGKFEVPVELEVADWRVPDPKDWAVQHHIYQSPESVAHYYKVPLWSDRHFELIGKSFEVLNQVGNKILPMNLIVENYCWGNREGMVRWVKDGKGGFTHDFSIVEKYMDAYKAKCGDPAVVYLSVWGHADWPTKKVPRKKVTVLDPATGEVSSMDQPPQGTPESEDFWRPVLAELRKRLEKRGWFKQTVVAYTSYSSFPSAKMVDVFKHIWPDGKWLNCSHVGPRSYKGSQGQMPVARCEWVWGCGGLYNPDRGNGHERNAYPRPWKRLDGDWVSMANPRIGTGITFLFGPSCPPSAFRAMSEGALQGDVGGLGRLGADFWPCLPDARGRMRTMDVAEYGLGFNNTVRAMLSPGEDGAVFNEKLEMFREGVQVTEAIVQVQRGLESGKLSADLTGRAEALLDERARYFLHTLDNEIGPGFTWGALECSAWQERDRKLFALAAEVAKALGGK